MQAPEKAKRGRPVLPPEQRQTDRVEMRCTKAQREKLTRLGGAQWLRERIDRACEADNKKLIQESKAASALKVAMTALHLQITMLKHRD